MPKPPPKAPAANAPKAEHKRHAKEVLEFEDYKHKPPGHPKDDDEIEMPPEFK